MKFTKRYFAEVFIILIKEGKMEEIDLSRQITRTAIKVYKKLGPDLLDSTYKMCMKKIPMIRMLTSKRQIEFPFTYSK